MYPSPAKTAFLKMRKIYLGKCVLYLCFGKYFYCLFGRYSDSVVEPVGPVAYTPLFGCASRLCIGVLVVQHPLQRENLVSMLESVTSCPEF